MSNLSRVFLVVTFLFVLNGCAVNQPINDMKVDVGPDAKFQNTQNDSLALYQLGRSYQKQKRYPEAIDAYEKALALDPDSAQIYNGMGVVYSLQGEHELAVQLIKEAIRLSPNASHLYNNLGYAYLRFEDLARAADAFERALALNPENLQARQNLAATYKRMGCESDQPCGRWQQPDKSK